MPAPSIPYNTLISCQIHMVWISDASFAETAPGWDAGAAQYYP